MLDILYNIDSAYLVCAVALIYLGVSRLIMNAFIDKNKVKEIQDESKRLQKELKAATDSKDQKKIEEVSKDYEKFMPKMLEMSTMQLKPLFILFPVLFLISGTYFIWGDAPLMQWPEEGFDANTLDLQRLSHLAELNSSGLRLSDYNSTTLNFSNSDGQNASFHLVHHEYTMLVFENPRAWTGYYILNGETLFSIHARPDTKNGGNLTVFYPTTAIKNPLAVKNMFRGFTIELPFDILIWGRVFDSMGWFWISFFAMSIGLYLITAVYNKFKGKFSFLSPAVLTANKEKKDCVSDKPELNTGLVEDKNKIDK